VIGPNGAGKSTLINLLSGDLAPSGGRIRLEGREIAGLSADRIARLGVGRSYQKTNIFRRFTAFENCRLAAQARLPSSMRFFRPARSRADINDAARAALAAAGLESRAEAIASTLSHGEQRQLEIAMTLATRPRLLLLDEPLAGMGAEESSRMVELLARLRESHAILLVEHDMDAVFSLADRLTVMVNGRVLESGTPEAIRASAAVQEAYLGTEEMALA
jgi:branched-chain amino acid transport system ATP-binding protein